MRTLCIALGLTGAALLFVGPRLSTAEKDKPSSTNWSHWRGPSEQGWSDDVRIPLQWDEKTNVLWKTALPGEGHSTPIVWGDRIFLTTSRNKGDERYVVCVRASDGKILWEKLAAKGGEAGKTHLWNTYASPSCTTDGKYVFAFFGTPGLFCYNMEGELVWKKSFGVFTSETGWGVGASPYLYDDLVILNCDNDGTKALVAAGEAAAPMSLVALEKATGKVRWTTPRDQGRGFSTPRLLTGESGRVDLVLNGPLGVWGYDPHTGKERWHCLRTDSGDQARFGEPLPVTDGKLLFVESGRPGPCQAIKLPCDGDVTTTNVVWSGVRKGHRDVASPILWDGLVYAADNKGLLSCLDLKTGKELYNDRISAKGKALASPIAVRGKLLFLMDDGETVVIEPGPKLKIVGRNRLGAGEALDFGASPAVADGRLFLRSKSMLYCIAER